jgi:uncharacterized protein
LTVVNTGVNTGLTEPAGRRIISLFKEGERMSLAIFSKREEEILSQCVEIIKRGLDPDKIIIFGSRAKGSAVPHSDFDIAVDAFEPDYKTLAELREKIDAISGLYKVDIIFMKQTDIEFNGIIKETGVVLYER